MALQQLLLVSSTMNLFPCHTRIHTYSPSLHPKLFHTFSSQPIHLRLASSLNCSLDYKQHTHNYNQLAYPKPPTLPWRKDLTNSVQLIGIVGAPLETKHLPSGKVLAWTRLAVKKSATDTTWINLTFWDELAQVALQHVEKGQQIYVSGRLVSDTVENDDRKQQTYYKVVVQQLNFVERNSSSVVSDGRDTSFMMAAKKIGNNANNSMGSTEELWQTFFANPLEWWDNRVNKRSPKYPDFKHKDTGEALWVEGRNNPPWVKSQLEILDTRMGNHREHDSRMHVNSMSPSDLLQY